MGNPSVTGRGCGIASAMSAFGPLRTLSVFPENRTAWNTAAWFGTRPTAHSAPRLSSALRAPPLCRCAERTADLILRLGWTAGARNTEYRMPSVAAGAARRGRFLGRREADRRGRCAQRTSLSFWPRLSERSARRARSEFCGPTDAGQRTLRRGSQLREALVMPEPTPQGSRRVQRSTAPA